MIQGLELQPRATGTRVKDKTKTVEVPEAESGTPPERRISDETLTPEQMLRITNHLIRRIGDQLLAGKLK